VPPRPQSVFFSRIKTRDAPGSNLFELYGFYPRGAPRLTYGRSVAKAMDVFNLDHARWPELAADRARWRAMLQSGEAPPPFRHSRPRPRRPCPCPTPRSLGAPPACCGGAHQRRHRRVAANRCADYAPRQYEENLTGWLTCQYPLTPLWL
jgi:hypothetical protein